MDDVLIMAGGFGERLWPASSKAFPKQFMTANDGVTFLQGAMCRALALKPSGYVVVITRSDIAAVCLSQVAPYANKGVRVVVLVEPDTRHTSAAVMSGVCLCRFLSDGNDNKGKNAMNRLTLVITSDHLIMPMECFASDCKTAERMASEGNFVCFSVPPTDPNTGYGYIRTGKVINGDNNVRQIEEFVEKPSLDVAKQYLSSGNYSWNSGMFAFLPSTLLSEMSLLTPEITNAFNSVFKGNPPPIKEKDGVIIIDEWEELCTAYMEVPKIAIDKAVAEKTKKAVAVLSHFMWYDVGSWDTFAALCKEDAHGGLTEVDGRNNFVYSDIPVVLCGVSDLVVVVKNGALLIMKKGHSESVRDAVHKMEETAYCPKGSIV